MSRNQKLADEERMQAVQEYFYGKESYQTISERYKISKSAIKRNRQIIHSSYNENALSDLFRQSVD